MSRNEEIVRLAHDRYPCSRVKIGQQTYSSLRSHDGSVVFAVDYSDQDIGGPALKRAVNCFTLDNAVNFWLSDGELPKPAREPNSFANLLRRISIHLAEAKPIYEENEAPRDEKYRAKLAEDKKRIEAAKEFFAASTGEQDFKVMHYVPWQRYGRSEIVISCNSSIFLVTADSIRSFYNQEDMA